MCLVTRGRSRGISFVFGTEFESTAFSVSRDGCILIQTGCQGTYAGQHELRVHFIAHTFGVFVSGRGVLGENRNIKCRVFVLSSGGLFFVLCVFIGVLLCVLRSWGKGWGVLPYGVGFAPTASSFEAWPGDYRGCGGVVIGLLIPASKLLGRDRKNVAHVAAKDA